MEATILESSIWVAPWASETNGSRTSGWSGPARCGTTLARRRTRVIFQFKNEMNDNKDDLQLFLNLKTSGFFVRCLLMLKVFPSRTEERQFSKKLLKLNEQYYVDIWIHFKVFACLFLSRNCCFFRHIVIFYGRHKQALLFHIIRKQTRGKPNQK